MSCLKAFRSAVCAALCVFGVGAIPLATAQSYTFTVLSIGGDGLVNANDINNFGQIVGGARSLNDAQLWSNGTMQGIGTLSGGVSSAVKINDIGQIVGTSQAPYYSADTSEHGVI